jgi:hypothetical protein
MAEVGGFGLWWRSKGKVGSMMEVICGSLMDNFAFGESTGTKGSMMMMTVMAIASVLCG